MYLENGTPFLSEVYGRVARMRPVGSRFGPFFRATEAVRSQAAMPYVLRYSEKFWASAAPHGGTELGGRVLELLRKVEVDPHATGRRGMTPCTRHAPAGVGAWYLVWTVCEECFRLSPEDRPPACSECSELDEVIVNALAVFF